MSDMPSHVTIKEVGPREGFQFEKGDIGLAAKISLVDALSDTGVSFIEFTSFVSPKWVPQMADAEQMVAGIKRVPGVAYEAIWLNEAGLERAARLRESLALRPMFGVAATDTFTRKNTNRSVDEKIAELPGWARRYQALGMDWIDVGVMAAFGCNYEGDVTPAQVIRVIEKVEEQAVGCGSRLGNISLADTMGWANPRQIKRLVGAVRARWPEIPVKLHLHTPRARHRQRGRRARDRRGSLRQRGGGPRRLPVRGPPGRGRQRHHRGPGLPLPGAGHRHRHRSRRDDRGRTARRTRGGPPATWQAQVGRQPREGRARAAPSSPR
jgi:hydroxymethylglutaryl-CoA lyase